jgi:hypothetical protein
MRHTRKEVIRPNATRGLPILDRAVEETATRLTGSCCSFLARPSRDSLDGEGRLCHIVLLEGCTRRASFRGEARPLRPARPWTSSG